MELVIDASVAVRWFATDESHSIYPKQVYQCLGKETLLHVPMTFTLEIANTLLRCKRQERLSQE